jgi:hypothetical protein
VPSNNVPKHPKDKLGIPDGICHDDKGNLIYWRCNVEEDHYSAGCAYLSRAYKSIENGGSYKDLKNVIVLAVCGYSLFPLSQSISRHASWTKSECFKGFEIAILTLFVLEPTLRKQTETLNP